MQPDSASYVGFLALGAVAVCLDALLIRRSGATYLAEVYPQRTTADSGNRLVTVLFCLAMLGALAVVSVVDLPLGAGLPNLVLRLGVLFLIMAAARGVTVWVLARMRAARSGLRLYDETTLAQERLNDIPAGSVRETEVERSWTPGHTMALSHDQQPSDVDCVGGGLRRHSFLPRRPLGRRPACHPFSG